MAHDNCGHPLNTDFARMLRLGNARPEVWKWVKHNFTCPECQAEKRPHTRNPSAVPKTFRLNHVVGVDLVDVKNHEGVTQHWLNVICWGTSFQFVKILNG